MTFPVIRLQPHNEEMGVQAPNIFDYILHTNSVPEKLNRDNINLHPSLGDNGWAPDCTGESARELMNVTALLEGYQLAIMPGTGLAAYQKWSGIPDTASKDEVAATNGLDMLTAAQGLQHIGFNTGYQNYLGIWGKAPSASIDVLAAGSAKFGILWVGAAIYEADQESFYSYGPWDDDGTKPRGRLVGLHAFLSGWGYNGKDPASVTTSITWGAQKQTTWRWLQQRLSIALCVRFPQLDYAGASPLDEQKLTLALNQWSEGSFVA